MEAILDYTVDAFLFSLLCVPFVIIIRYFVYVKTGKFDLKRELYILLLCMCITSVLCETIIPPQLLSGDFSTEMFHPADFSYFRQYPGLQTGWILWMLKLKDYAAIFINIGGNILVFLPIGLLIPLIRGKADVVPLLCGFSLSCFIEVFQLFIDRNSDYNDIILNTAGTITGLLIYLLISKRKEKRTD